MGIEETNTLVFMVDLKATKQKIKDAVKEMHDQVCQGEHPDPPRRQEEGLRSPHPGLRRPGRRQQDRHHLSLCRLSSPSLYLSLSRSRPLTASSTAYQKGEQGGEKGDDDP